jgi:hypothetical protein
MDGIIELDPSGALLSAAGPDHIRTPLRELSRFCFKTLAAVTASLTLIADCFESLFFSNKSDVVGGGDG